MQRDGENPSIMDMDPEKSVASQLQEEEDEDIVDDGPPLKEDPKYTKYFKMLKMVSMYMHHCLKSFALLSLLTSCDCRVYRRGLCKTRCSVMAKILR